METRRWGRGDAGQVEGTQLSAPPFRVSPAPYLAFSGRDSSRQNADCLGAWSSKRRASLTPRPGFAKTRRHGDAETQRDTEIMNMHRKKMLSPEGRFTPAG